VDSAAASTVSSGDSGRDDVAVMMAAVDGEQHHAVTNRRVASALIGVGDEREWLENELRWA
jgi:hypothetical protein